MSLDTPGYVQVGVQQVDHFFFWVLEFQSSKAITPLIGCDPTCPFNFLPFIEAPWHNDPRGAGILGLSRSQKIIKKKKSSKINIHIILFTI